MFPEDFKQRITDQKYIDSEALLEALEETSPVSIRLNASKWNRRPLNPEPVPWCKTGYYLENRPSYTLDPLFHSGCYYPQEASGMFLEQTFRQSVPDMNNIRVLDLCGAPGGKSILISDIIGPGNLLVANEAIRSRSVILSETVTKWGSGNVLVTQNDPAAFGKMSGYFDIIFVDAPCSGEGMFRSQVALNEWSSENSAHCSDRQKRIIMDVWPALKENGIMIYSTCTFNPGENEENIKWLTGKHEAESVRLDITEFNGITEIDFDGIYGYGFYPDKIKGEGFFISVLRKTGRQEKLIIRSQRKYDMKPGKAEKSVAERWTSFPEERLLKWRDELIAVPCGMNDYFHLFQNTSIVKPGIKIFTVKKSDFLPMHELALSVFLKKGVFPENETELSEVLTFLKRDSFSLKNAPRGWNLIRYKGVNMGFVNNIGNRVNNYFPVEWRIRMNLPEPGKENLITWVDELII
jgi:16S rRNA C967 or C1407 C5-methylase (RsmB/RsmF family)/NOL1/NOP2/fmu family ribosome biogenesis protein